ncbi:hypothetical protein [Methanosarcina spelaei]|nr:hypothetical protein [Methanosarcina spelaei]
MKTFVVEIYGDDLMRIKIALALMSAIFMFYWTAALIISCILWSISVTILSFGDLTELLSIISFLGSVLFLVEARKVLPRWYLAVPLCISLFVLVIVNFWVIFSGRELLSDHIGIAETLVMLFMALLSPFSALVFLSMDRHPASMNAYLAVSSVASMLSMSLLFFTLSGLSHALSRGGPTFDAVVAFQAFYWLFVMPVIGICFLVRAITYRNPGNVLNPVTIGST